MKSKLNSTELSLMEELIEGNTYVQLPKRSCPKPIRTFEEVLALTDAAIRKIIKQSKRLSRFRNMCEEDQIALLKGGCIEMMLLRAVMSYDPKEDVWQVSSRVVHHSKHAKIY